MVALIKEQIHQFLMEQEEKRCRALEEEYNRSEETKGKTVKRKTISKPRVRSGKYALCQEIDLLIMVDEYDYDLSDKKFQDYCLARGVLHVSGKIGSKRWQYFLDHRKSKNDYLTDPYFQYAEEVDGKRHQYTNEEMEIGWKIMMLGRAQLQDCWELYSQELTD